MTYYCQNPGREPKRAEDAAAGGTPPSVPPALDPKAEELWATSSRPHFGTSPLATAALPAPEKAPDRNALMQEHPAIGQPTQTWGYRWLGVGVALGSAAALGSAVGLTLIAATYLAYAASPVVTAASALLVALSWRRTHERWFGSSGTPPQAKDTDVRLTSMARGLASQLGVEVPIFFEAPIGGIAVNPFLKPAAKIFYDPQIVEALSNDQCEWVVAHELCHCKQAFPKILFKMRCANGAAVLSAAMACYVYCLNTGSSFVYSSLLGAGCYIVSNVALKLLAFFPERANEIRTDIQAVELTQNPDASVEALKTVYAFVGEQQPDGWRPLIAALQPITSHPSLAMRVRWLSYVCGNAPETPKRFSL